MSKSSIISRNKYGILIANSNKYLVQGGRVRKIDSFDIEQTIRKAVSETYKVSGKDVNRIVVTRAFSVPNRYKYSASTDVCSVIATYDEAFRIWNLQLETKRTYASHRRYGRDIFSVRKMFDVNLKAASIVLK